MKNLLKQSILRRMPEIDRGLVLLKDSPHTISLAHLKECHSGVLTAQYYFCAKYFDLISKEEALLMTAELKKLQITDESAPNFGCMLWYKEEEFVNDSNGAFFTLLPLALAYKLCPEKMSEKEKEDILYLLKNSSHWFSMESKGSLHYCNKIMSDGAMLALIADTTGECRDECDEFWTKWNRYADDYGWGWGENTSDCYSAIMLNALNVAVITLEGELKKKAEKRRELLLDYISFHNGKEFVPSIRTYNFNAKVSYGGSVYRTFHSPEEIGGFDKNVVYNDIIQAVLITESGAKWVEKDASCHTRKEHLFLDSYAYTWEDENIRLGTVSHFPVMPCSYQNQAFAPDGTPITYGLGWQSMPVSAMLDDKIGFLRTRTVTNGNTHCHPLEKKQGGHMFNRLFEDGNITVFSTLSSQNENIAITAKYANKLANTASFIADEWCIPESEITETEINNRHWFIVKGNEKALALCPIDGIAFGENSRTPMKSYIGKSGIFSTVTTELYSGENKLLFTPRLESVWIIVALESIDSAEEYLKKLIVTDEILPNFEITLQSPYKKRKISCIYENIQAELIINPTEQIDF